MVAAQVQIGRVVTVSLDTGGMEDIINAQQAFEVAIGVHIAATARSETIFEDAAQLAVGVGGRQGVEITACHYGVGAGKDELADGVCLSGTLHEVAMQGDNGALNDFGFAASVAGVGKVAFPFMAVLVDAGGLQVIIEQANGVVSQDDVALHAAIGALRIGYELGIDKRVTTEYGYRKYSLRSVFRGH